MHTLTLKYKPEKPDVTADMMLAELKVIVQDRKKFEEDDLMYNFPDCPEKDRISECMGFFYQNLWNKEISNYIWHEDTEWEDYNIGLKYKGHYSKVSIFYGIGAFCCIVPEKNPDSLKAVFDLEKFKTSDGNISYLE